LLRSSRLSRFDSGPERLADPGKPGRLGVEVRVEGERWRLVGDAGAGRASQGGGDTGGFGHHPRLVLGKSLLDTAVAAGATPAATPPAATPRVVSQEEEFGLRVDQKEEKLGQLSEIVATVTDVRAKPHGELIITLANEQVYYVKARDYQHLQTPGEPGDKRKRAGRRGRRG